MFSRVKIILLLVVLPSLVLAQPGQGRQFNPETMAQAEKQLLFDSISGLNEDQKLIIDEIYKDFSTASSKARDGMDTNNREAMRETMMLVSKEKDEALQAILTSEQYSKFSKMLDRRREQGRNRRRNND